MMSEHAAGRNVAAGAPNAATSTGMADMDSMAAEAIGTAALPLAGGKPKDEEAAAEQEPEALNKKALDIIHRVRDKLTGRDFSHDDVLDVPEQVDRLIEQATNNENLCQSYIGWCPFW